jgi:erythronate-4-phosphate dehydrogenase
VLDVWEHEPEPDPALVEAVTLGTPHIAGYSFDGKVNGTRMLYDAVCAFLERARERSFPTVPSERHAPPVEIEADASLGDILRSLVGKAYDIRRDDAALRASMKLPQPERARAFDHLRAEYPIRLEFRHTTVAVPSQRMEVRQALHRLGFTIVA